jgi:hypothetical protein
MYSAHETLTRITAQANNTSIFHSNTRNGDAVPSSDLLCDEEEVSEREDDEVSEREDDDERWWWLW